MQWHTAPLDNAVLAPALLLCVLLVVAAALFGSEWDWATGTPQKVATVVLFLSAVAFEGLAQEQHYTRWPALLWSNLA
eukprot:179016-Rhodomonas_salina.1